MAGCPSIQFGTNTAGTLGAEMNKSRAAFIETMDCLPVSKEREGPGWTYEIELDGYRLEAVKHKGKVTVYSRPRNVLNQRFAYIADVLNGSA